MVNSARGAAWRSSLQSGSLLLAEFIALVDVPLSYLYPMATKSTSARSPRKAPLTSKTLRRVSETATKSASRSAFDEVDELLVVKEGWLVKVDKSGKVMKRVKRIKLPAA